MIAFEHITKTYKDTAVLSDVSLEIASGELAVLIGPSGCGKTTSLKMINRLLAPTSGRVLINGEDIAEKDVIKLRRNMGYVIQHTGLFPHLTVRENIELVPLLEKRNPKDVVARSRDLMDMIGLDADQYLDRFPAQLSGGQKQRVGVARAFALDPEIILMDEPFSAIDPITREQLQEELVGLQARFRKTIVFVTHDIAEAVKIADRICLMHDGGIAQFGTREDLLKNPANDFVRDFVGKQRIWTAPELIRAKDIMIANPVSISPDATVADALRKIHRNGVDSLVAVDKNNVVAGVLRRRDARACRALDTPVAKVMKTKYPSISLEQSIPEVLAAMQNSNISSIPVLGGDGTLRGLITKSSLVDTLSQQFLGSKEGGSP